MKIVPFTKKDQQTTKTFMENIYKEMSWLPKPKEGLDDLEAFFHLPTQGFCLLLSEITR